MYKIKISQMRFIAIIGILEYERHNPQKVQIDFECEYDDKKNFIDYMEIVQFLKTSITEKKYKLIEDGIDDICTCLEKKYANMKNIFIQITKLEILENGTISIANK